MRTVPGGAAAAWAAGDSEIVATNDRIATADTTARRVARRVRTYRRPKKNRLAIFRLLAIPNPTGSDIGRYQRVDSMAGYAGPVPERRHLSDQRRMRVPVEHSARRCRLSPLCL